MNDKRQLSLITETAAAFGLVLLTVPVVLTFRYGNLLASIGTVPMFAFAMAGTSIIHFFGRPSRLECCVTIILAVALQAVYQFSFHPTHYFGYWVISWGSFMGFASLIVLAVQAMRIRTKSALSNLVTGGMFLYFWIILGFAFLAAIHLMPRRYDQLLYAFDTSLGVHPSFQLGQLIHGSRFLENLVADLYFACGVPPAVLWATQRRTGYRMGFKIFPILVVASTGAYLLYYVLPGAGPIYEFPSYFPLRFPPVDLNAAGRYLPVMERTVNNAMPSMHFGGALLVYWNCRAWSRPARAIVLACLIGTAFATLALGQHYLIDLVVSFPLMLAFHAAAITSVPLNSRERLVPIVAGMGATFAWLTFLRFGVGLCLSLPALPWILVLTTVTGTLFLENRLWKKAQSLLVSESQERTARIAPSSPLLVNAPSST
jgi:hypothetical protein